MSALKLNLHKSNSAFLFLLSLFTIALLMDKGIHWTAYKSTSVLILLVIIQFINFRLWWAGAAAVCVGIYTVMHHFPQTANHSNIMFIGSIIIFIMLSCKVLLNRAPRADTITIAFRWAVIAIYFWAGFHKLNSGFFSLEGSCSVYINHYSNQLLFGQDFKPSLFVLRASQIGTIILEMVVPAGLLFYRTRRLAAILLVIFHFYLVLCNFTNFGAFALFLIAGCTLDLNKPVSSYTLRSLRMYQLTALITVLCALLLKYFKVAADDAAAFLLYTNILFGLGFALFGIRYFIAYKEFRLGYRLVYVPVICLTAVSLWAAQGYVGLSTSSTLTMFSNLITEKSRCNHYLIDTRYTKIWDFEEDYVEIINLKKSGSWGKKYDLYEYYVPLIEFKNAASNRTRRSEEIVQCTLVHKGKRIVIDDLKNSDFIKGRPWWSRFLTYRGIRKDGTNECLW